VTLDDEVLTQVRSGRDTRFRIKAALANRHPDDVACSIARLIWQGHIRQEKRRLVLAK
jgi:hypothetical protein